MPKKGIRQFINQIHMNCRRVVMPLSIFVHFLFRPTVTVIERIDYFLSLRIKLQPCAIKEKHLFEKEKKDGKGEDSY